MTRSNCAVVYVTKHLENKGQVKSSVDRFTVAFNHVPKIQSLMVDPKYTAITMIAVENRRWLNVQAARSVFEGGSSPGACGQAESWAVANDSTTYLSSPSDIVW